uniref:Diacylglycerol kinase n=1 Tax=Pyramimonas obovata TaxID=1411642 RepID=A0A7S0RMR8_9CHLO|mmetsp:Transcript_38391/g.83518  ORF Transcript_38391/g.83518 Transcript_38391/m.83518 type:complete len:448 (+) Transcript_38391:172-1515(+)
MTECGQTTGMHEDYGSASPTSPLNPRVYQDDESRGCCSWGLDHNSTWEEINVYAREQDEKRERTYRRDVQCCCRFPWLCGHNVPIAKRPPGPVPHVCFMVNLKSGVGRGADLCQTLKSVDDVTVIDLQKLCPTPDILRGQVLKVIQLHHRAQGIRIVAAGGDGTVSWVASLIEEACQKLNIDNVPMAVLPCGVGNEVSRCTGFGASYGGESLENFVVDVMTGRTAMLDTWTVTIEEESGRVEERIAVCFFSAGFDASIAHRFHQMRERSGSKPISNTLNKAWHVWYGIVEGMSFEKYVREDSMDLRVDSLWVKLPPRINTVQIMSLPSSADGNDFFGLGQASGPHELQNYSYPNFGDGLLEVVGTGGVAEVVAIRNRAAHSHRLAQGGRVELVLHKPTPVQMDGEPWMQEPCTVTMEARGKQPVVIGRGSTRGAGIRRQSWPEMEEA